jgi:thymidylate synthase (FAD)
MNLSDLPIVTKRPTVPAAEEILGLYFPVLDHGFLALTDYMGGDVAIEQAARVAYGAGTRPSTETRGLIRYLHRHRHTSPLEMTEVKLHCAMPIFVARQWIRHRTANVNEMSGRYSLLPMQFYTPPRDQLRPQSQANKQGRDLTSGISDELANEAYETWRDSRATVMDDYGWLTRNDFARELARIDLPLSTYTQWYWKIDLHNLMHFLTLRVDAHAQWEIQQYGKIIAGMLKRLAPLAYEAWIDYEVCGARLSRMELNLLRMLRKVGYELRFKDLEQEGSLPPEGLTKREWEEFQALFADRPVSDFELDLTTAKSPEYFEELAKAAVPAGK